MAREHFFHRRIHFQPFIFRFFKHMALVQAQAHIKADQHQHDGSHKRNAPSPFHQRIGTEYCAHAEKCAIGHQ